MAEDRTALLICCSAAEAKTIRSQAKIERRTLSGYILNILLQTLPLEERLGAAAARAVVIPPEAKARRLRPRTAVLMRCSMAEAIRIRAAAARRGVSISAYVLYRLKRHWGIRSVPLAL